MAKRGGGIGAYNAIIGAIKARTGVSHREAQQTYRAAAVRLGKSLTLTDAKKSAVVKQEAGRAGKQIAAAQAAKMRATERAIERAKQPRNKDRGAVRIPPPGRRRGGEEGGGGGGGGGRAGGGGGGSRRAPVDDYDPDFAELEPPDEIGGDDGDYAPD